MASLLPQDLESAQAGCAPDAAVELCPAGASIHAEPQIGVVVIGRNEGERLRRCLESLSGALPNIVYVDSGSADGSVQMAQALGVHVVNLDLSRPFTAARARNAGFDELLKLAPNTDLVQFVDGDCEVVGDWLRTAGQFSWSHERCAIVCGRRRERFPEKSVYNRLCDMEWDTPVGEATWCGGDFLMRASAFSQLNGFAADMIAGEEPELCSRVLERGWQIMRLDAEMTIHDAAIARFGQWWRRMVRSGHAAAELTCRQQNHLSANGRIILRSLVFWTLALPAAALALAFVNPYWALALLSAGYGLQCCRILRKQLARGYSLLPAAQYAAMILLGKFAELSGALRYFGNRLRRGKSRLIEYK